MDSKLSWFKRKTLKQQEPLTEAFIFIRFCLKQTNLSKFVLIESLS